MAFAIGPAIGGMLCDLYGPRVSFFVIGGCAGLCGVGFSMLPETKPRNIRVDTITDASNEKDSQQSSEAILGKSYLEVYGPLLKSPNQQGVISMNFALFTSYSAMLVLIPLNAIEVTSLTAGDIGWLFAAGGTIGLVGAPLGGYLADKLGRVRTIVPATGLISLGAGAMSLPFIDSFSKIAACVVLWSLGNSLMGPGLSAYTADISGKENRGEHILSLDRTIFILQYPSTNNSELDWRPSHVFV